MAKTYVHRTSFYLENTPQALFNCTNLDKYFSSNHRIISTNQIPIFYKDIQTQFMKYFKQEPTNLLDILNQSI